MAGSSAAAKSACDLLSDLPWPARLGGGMGLRSVDGGGLDIGVDDE